MSAPKSSLPLVSVCVPTCNGASHLEECLASIQAQTFADFEVIITDDASDDATLAIAKKFAEQDGRFQVHANPARLGLVGNFNCGIQLARGEWIKLVSQDDLLRPECLARMLAAAREEKSKFIACRREFIFSADTPAETRAFYAQSAAGIDHFFRHHQTRSPESFAKAILECIGANFIGEPTAVMFQRELIGRCGRFNESLIMCCDSEYWYRLGTATAVTFIPETLAEFRVHGASASALNFDRRRFQMEHLDLLVVVHEFMHHPHYARLRAVAEKYFGAKFLDHNLRERAWQAWSGLQEKLAAKSGDAGQCRQEWEAMGAAYPRLQEPASPPDLAEKILAARPIYSLRKMTGKILRAASQPKSPL